MVPISALESVGETGTVTLDDGRDLGYAQFGADDGTPVLAFNGTPGSRWFGAFFDAVGTEQDCSVLVLERPGCGRSDLLPDRRLSDWPRDVAAATERLGIEEFGIVAFSGGTPHALACGVDLSDRVTGIALASPAGPPETMTGALQYRAVFWLARNAPWVLSPLVSTMVWTSRRGSPQQVAANYVGPDVLDVTVADDVTAAQAAYGDFLGAFEQGTDGPLAEIRLVASDWDIDLSAVDVPVVCWHSDADREAPLGAAQTLCAAIPDSELHVRTDEHHGEVLVRCREQLLASVS